MMMVMKSFPSSPSWERLVQSSAFCFFRDRGCCALGQRGKPERRAQVCTRRWIALKWRNTQSCLPNATTALLNQPVQFLFNRLEPNQQVTASSVQVDEKSIPPLFIHHPRSTRYILRLRPDGTVRVTIPYRGSLKSSPSIAPECERTGIPSSPRPNTAGKSSRNSWLRTALHGWSSCSIPPKAATDK